MRNETINEIPDLQAGKAGEYIVCADLILSGYTAFLSDQGMQYDVVLDYNGKLLKVQVKSTRIHKNNDKGVPSYIFNIGSNGKGNRRKKYNQSQINIFALVALDSRKTAYMPFFDHHTTLSFRVPELRGSYPNEKNFESKKYIIEMSKSGMSNKDISDETGLTVDAVYKITSGRFTGGQNGRYFDEFTLSKCLENF